MALFSKKDFKNTQWFIAEKLLQVLVGLFIIPQIFTSLGTEEIGKLEFSKTLLGTLSPLFFLGLSAICIRELIFKPKDKHKIIATTLILRLLSFLVILSALIIYNLLTKRSDISIILLIICFSYLFKITDVFDFYLQATKQSHVLFIAKFCALILSLLAQYYGVNNNYGILYFASILLIDALTQGLIYSFYLFRNKQLDFKFLNFCKITAKNLLSSAFPLFISNVLIMFYIAIDEFFLKYFINDTANGIFATVQFLVIFLTWNIGAALVYGLYPALAEVYNNDKEMYFSRMRKMGLFLILFGISIGVFYTFLGDVIINTFYDASFNNAKIPLKIFCWAPLFIFIGMLYEKHLINQNQLLNNVYRFSIGCIVNIILCFLLIPIYNVNGAAAAVLISHIITNVGYIFIDKSNSKKFKSLIKELIVSK